MDVYPLIVFVDPRADLEIIDPTVPVLYATPKKEPSIKSFLRDIQVEEEEPEEPKSSKGRRSSKSKKPKTPSMPLTDEQIDAFEEATLP